MPDHAPFATEIPLILQPEERLYFLHIPKTAGQSFSKLLELFYSPDEVLVVHAPQVKDVSDEKLLQYRFYTGHHGYRFLNRFTNKKPIWITMIRHPVDRVTSGYYFHRQQAIKYIQSNKKLTANLELALNSDFYSYVTDVEAESRIYNRQTWQLYETEQLSFEEFRLIPTNDIIDIVKERLTEECAFFGITDRFDNSVALFYYTFAWRPHIVKREKRVNATKERPNLVDVDPQIIDHITEKNQLDIEIYQFATTLFAKRYDAMMRQILQKNYDKLFSQHHHPLSAISIEHHDPIFDTKSYADGWHTTSEQYRWTGPENISLIDLCLSSEHTYTIHIDIERGVTLEVLQSFELYVNQHLIPLSWESIGHSTRVSGIIPQNILNQQRKRTELIFQVHHTAHPLDNPQDQRLLGIALKRVDIAPQTVHGVVD